MVLRLLLGVLVLLVVLSITPTTPSGQAVQSDNPSINVSELPIERAERCIQLEYRVSALITALVFATGALTPEAYRYGRDYTNRDGGRDE